MRHPVSFIAALGLGLGLACGPTPPPVEPVAPPPEPLEPARDTGPGADEPPVDEGSAPTADLRNAGASAFGGRTRQELWDSLRTQDTRARHCYETAQRAGQTPQGAVTVRLVVTPTGAVQKSEVLDNGSGSDAYAECLASVARRIPFPADEAPLIVIHTFDLRGQ